MSLEEAKAFWPKGLALGKLNVVFADGKDPRLVLDSTICGVNPRCHIPERVTLPMAADLRLATQPHDSHGAFIGASLDFKASLLVATCGSLPDASHPQPSQLHATQSLALRG